MKPILVALDTNVFETGNYFFGGDSDLGILKKHIDDGRIAGLFICDIVIEEAKKHFREKAKEINKKVSVIRNSREWKGLSSAKSLMEYVQPVDEVKIVEEMGEAFDKYLADTKTQIIKCDKVKIKDILFDYFNDVPPFGGTDKKHEFPDAIMLRRIKEIAKAYDGKIYVVSDDADWASALKGDENIILFNKLKDLFDLITRNDKLSSDFVEYFSKHRNEFNEQVKEYLYVKPYTVDGYIYGRKGIEGGYEYIDTEIVDTTIQSKFNNIDYIGDEEIIARILVQTEFEIECKYRDEENSVWDSEEHEYHYDSTGMVIEEHAVNFYVIATYKITDGKIDKCIRFEPRLKKMLYFNNLSLVDRRRKHNEFFSYDRSYICPQCGQSFKVDLMGYVDETTSTADRGMGAEFAHSILCEDECPHCGRKYKISGEIYEYPIGAFNADETKIEWEDKE